MAAADALRLRFRELLQQSEMSQAQLCARLTKRTGMLWRESRLSKILNGHIAWEVDDLVMMADEARMSLVDLMREPGREFVADCTPTEMQVLAVVRENPALARHILALLPPVPTRGKKPLRRRAVTRREFHGPEE